MAGKQTAEQLAEKIEQEWYLAGVPSDPDHHAATEAETRYALRRLVRLVREAAGE